MRVRKLLKSDREAIINIINATENLTAAERDCAVELLDIYLTNPLQNDYFFIVATDSSDSPSGYVCYGKTPLTDAVYDLYWILVDRRLRHKGIGRALLEHTEEVLKRQGARMLVAETSGLPAYETARSFYRRSGFAEESRIKDFYKPCDDLITFVKRF
ncbi:MAG: GNAT family N-acetyltransferase [Deltaproteobacteria bacterium]|nr:GNAT family N-acetyltransferase [Deltaproteobacteria bacterium]